MLDFLFYHCLISEHYIYSYPINHLPLVWTSKQVRGNCRARNWAQQNLALLFFYFGCHFFSLLLFVSYTKYQVRKSIKTTFSVHNNKTHKRKTSRLHCDALTLETMWKALYMQPIQSLFKEPLCSSQSSLCSLPFTDSPDLVLPPLTPFFYWQDKCIHPLHHRGSNLCVCAGEKKDVLDSKRM